MSVYADTSFFVSIYIQDAHSSLADQLLASGERPWFTPLHSAEWAHALSQQIFFGKMSAGEARNVEEELRRDRASGLWPDAGLMVAAFDTCADLARRHGASLGTRTLDSLHVACALHLKAERFWTFDQRQSKLAQAEGLKTS